MAKTQILIVEDESIVAKDLKNTLELMGYEVPKVVSSGEDAIKKAEELLPDLILMDIMLKGHITGVEAASVILSKVTIPIIYLTAYSDEDTLQKIKTSDSYGYILKPFKEAELDTTIKMALHKHKNKYKNDSDNNTNSISTKKLNQIVDSLLKTFSVTLEENDSYRKGRNERTSKLANAIAKEMNLSEEQILTVKLSAFLQNIGDIFTPSHILTKTDTLTESERNIIKTHSQSGYDILKEMEFPLPIAKIVYQIHERIDGSGYPNGLTESDILLEAKIVAVADVVEAMSHPRTYRRAFSIREVIEEITNNKDKLYDPEVVYACVKLFEDKGYKF